MSVECGMNGAIDDCFSDDQRGVRWERKMYAKHMAKHLQMEYGDKMTHLSDFFP